MSKLMVALRNTPPIKRLLNLIDRGEIDLKNSPFDAFKWFDSTPANTHHALLNVLLILEGLPPIKYDETGRTIDPRLPLVQSCSEEANKVE